MRIMESQKSYTIIDHMIVNGNVASSKDLLTLIKIFIKQNPWVLKRTREREIVYTRRFLSTELLLRYKMSSVKVGEMFGFDHATILHHKKIHFNLIDSKDKLYKGICDAVTKEIDQIKMNLSDSGELIESIA